MVDVDFYQQVRKSLPELEEIEDDDLRDRVVEAWSSASHAAAGAIARTSPYAWNIREVTNVERVRGVTRIALETAREQRELHGANPDIETVVSACLLHDIGKCYEYPDHVDGALFEDPDPRYASEEIPNSISEYVLAHEVGCPLAVQRAIPHFLGEVAKRTLEAELVKSTNSASSNAITEATMRITLQEWVEEYSQTA